jgi:Fur family transcriptional regulator, ferric uptake regulator
VIRADTAAVSKCVTAAQLHGAPVIAKDPETAGQAVKAHGLRLSAARRLVLEALYAADAPVAAEEIAAGLGGRLPRSDLASVYRNLDTLEQVGLVRHVHLGHGPGRYTPSGRRCDFLVCERCGSVSAIERERLQSAREAIRLATGFEARFHHFPISGLCSCCGDAG